MFFNKKRNCKRHKRANRTNVPYVFQISRKEEPQKTQKKDNKDLFIEIIKTISPTRQISSH